MTGPSSPKKAILAIQVRSAREVGQCRTRLTCIDHVPTPPWVTDAFARQADPDRSGRTQVVAQNAALDFWEQIVTTKV